MYHIVQALPDAVSQYVRVLSGKLVFHKHPGPDGIVNIVIDIGDLVGKTDNGPFQGRRMARGPVV